MLGKGIVTNLSQTGMHIRGDHEVEPGLDLSLRLTRSDGAPMIDIERATVRWVDAMISAWALFASVRELRTTLLIH